MKTDLLSAVLLLGVLASCRTPEIAVASDLAPLTDKVLPRYVDYVKSGLRPVVTDGGAVELVPFETDYPQQEIWLESATAISAYLAELAALEALPGEAQ